MVSPHLRAEVQQPNNKSNFPDPISTMEAAEEQLLLAAPEKRANSNSCRTEIAVVDSCSSYAAWKVRHPSALDMFDERMASMAAGKRVVLFLDYDGTLSPIVDDPDQAFMPEPMRLVLARVAENIPTCIISGRRRDKVKEFVQLSNIIYVGSHGLEMDISDDDMSASNSGLELQRREVTAAYKGNCPLAYQVPEEFVTIISEVAKMLEDRTNNIAGVLIENNKFCLTVHFRRVKKEDWSTLEKQVLGVVKGFPCLRCNKGRKVIEIRPSVAWDKGKAVEHLLDAAGFGHPDALPVYIGDDRTDEDAFEALRRRGRGLAVVVSSIAKETGAALSLRDPAEVLAFLLSLLKWARC